MTKNFLYGKKRNFNNRWCGLGSHTLVELYNSGYTPIVVDNLSNSSINNIRGAEEIIKNKIDFYQVDCTDFDASFAISSSDLD